MTMRDEPTGDDRGFLYGDGLFETVRVEEETGCFLERHRRRFERSAEFLEFPREATDAGLEALAGLDGREDGLWRVTVTRPASEGEGTVAVRRRQLPDPPEQGGVAVTVFDGMYFPGDRFAEHKTTSWLRNAEALRRARRDGYDEAILVSSEGRVGEASAANIFVRIGGGWVTPPVEGILPGVVRDVILEEAEAAGVPVEVRPLFVGDLQTCESAAVTSTGRLVTAISAIDNQPLSMAPVEQLQGLVPVG